MSNHDAYEFRPFRDAPAEMMRIAVYLYVGAVMLTETGLCRRNVRSDKWSKTGKIPAYGSGEFWPFWIGHITAYAEVLQRAHTSAQAAKIDEPPPTSPDFDHGPSSGGDDVCSQKKTGIKHNFYMGFGDFRPLATISLPTRVK
ncbi:hypothetical protein R3P38DRAFT_3232166 [Favolaschia claudopus]|uniref:Uncharacterized protein n=1 Tax=Favolaschia claudopus TaxID=2862362 RepID=A0AAV9ZIK5_9AGAR